MDRCFWDSDYNFPASYEATIKVFKGVDNRYHCVYQLPGLSKQNVEKWRMAGNTQAGTHTHTRTLARTPLNSLPASPRFCPH